MVGTARATRDARHLARLFKLRIDRIEPGLGIEAMRLAAPQVDALAPEAIGAAFGNDEQAGDIAPLVDTPPGRASSEERRAGKEWCRTCISRWSACNNKIK